MQSRVSTITEFTTDSMSKKITIKCCDCQKWVSSDQGVVDIGMFHGTLTKFIICKNCNDQFI